MTGITEQFEQQRGRLRAIAYRMLGSSTEADDAVQEAWLRLHRSGTGAIDNLAAWLTTVVARVCLDMLRTRQSRREDALPTADLVPARAADPEQEAILAESVGIALLAVLDRLAPAERIAFVLHDTFALPFGDIAAILGRTPAAVRQLASRARRRVRGAAPDARLRQQRALVQAFLAALRAGDLRGLLAVLDPEVVAVADGAATGTGAAREVRGAATWAAGAVAFSRTLRSGSVALALVDGSPGLIWAPKGRLARVLRFTFADGRITRVDIIANPDRLAALALAVLSP